MKGFGGSRDSGEGAERFRCGLVVKAHRLCVSLNSRLESNKEERGCRVSGAHEILVKAHTQACTLRVEYTLHPSPYTIHPTPYTLHRTLAGERGCRVSGAHDILVKLQRSRTST